MERGKSIGEVATIDIDNHAVLEGNTLSNKMNKIQMLFYKNAKDKISGLEPEVWIGRYRVDFYIGDQQIVIEIDGHKDHKTKEQRTHDAQRERYLQRLGLIVIRYTASEIYHDVGKCVEEVLQYLRSVERSGLSENSVWIDLTYLSRVTVKAVRYYRNEYPEKKLNIPSLSTILIEITKWLRLEGDYDVFIFGLWDLFSNSLIEWDVLSYLDYLDGVLTIYENHVNVDMLAVSLCEHLDVAKGRYQDVVLVGDDLAYVPLLQNQNLVTKLLRDNNEETRMIGLGSVRWQDMDYVIGTAIGLERHEL